MHSRPRLSLSLPLVFAILLLSGNQIVFAQTAEFTTSLDEFGYPQQGFTHPQQAILFPVHRQAGSIGWVPKSDLFDRFVDEKFLKSLGEDLEKQLRRRVIKVGKGTSTVTGSWQFLQRSEQPVNLPPKSFSVSKTRTMSSSEALEIGAEVSVSVSSDAKPFGVGVGVSLEASLGYAYSRTTSEERSKTWNPSFTIAPGQEIQVWQRNVRIVNEFDPATAFNPPPDEAHLFSAEDAFILAIAESYGPILWPVDEYGVDSYIDQTRHSRANTARSDVGKWKSILQRRSNFASFGESSIWDTIRSLVSFQKFASLGFVTVTRELPFPEFYPTYVTIGQEKTPRRTNLNALMSITAGSGPALDERDRPIQGKQYAAWDMPAKRRTIKTAFNWIPPKKLLESFLAPKRFDGNLKAGGFDRKELLKKFAGRGLRLPSVSINTNASWMRVGNQRCPVESSAPISLTVGNAISVSSEIAETLSVGLSASVEVAATPFGVGGSTTLTASVNAAKTFSRGVSDELALGETQDVLPGSHTYVWQQALELTADFIPSEALDKENPKLSFYLAIAESYGPVIWTQGEFGNRSYRDVTSGIRNPDGSRDTEKLAQLLDTTDAPNVFQVKLQNTNRTKAVTRNMGEVLTMLFDYDEFIKLPRQHNKYRLPFDEFTSSAFDFQKTPALPGVPVTEFDPKPQFAAMLNGPGFPDDARQKGNEFLDGLKSLAFDDKGGFALLFDKSGYWARSVPDQALHLVHTNARRGSELRSIGLAPSGGFSLITDKEFINRGVPGDVGAKMTEFRNAGHELKSISFTQSGAWSLIYGTNFFWNSPGVPDDAHKAMLAKHNAGETLQTIVYTPSGHWYLIASGKPVSGFAAPPAPTFRPLSGNFALNQSTGEVKEGRFYHVHPKTLVAGKTYEITVNGQVQMVLVVREGKDLQSNVLGGVTEGGSQPRYFFTPPKTGEYFINVTTKVPGATTEYTLLIREG